VTLTEPARSTAGAQRSLSRVLPRARGQPALFEAYGAGVTGNDQGLTLKW
jgi:hypothetical protein